MRLSSKKNILIILFVVNAYPLSAQINGDKNYSDPSAPVGSKALTMPATVKPILDHWMRDTYITYSPDGYYYMTGTVAVSKGQSRGIYLWRSTDMKDWKELGCIWSMDNDATWQKNWRPVRTKDWETNLPDSAYKGIWAPEIHFISGKNEWLIIACISHGGTFILRSTSGKPEGPYVNIEGNKGGPIFNHIDGSLFQDGKDVYVLGHNHFIAKMKDDLSNVEEPFKRLKETPYNPEPYLEGIYMTKIGDKYQLIQTAWSVKEPDGAFTYIRPDAKRNDNIISYDVVVAESDNIYGPYGPRYPAILEGGHNNLFKGKDGKWWSTTFFNPRGQKGKEFPVTCRPAVVAVKMENGKLMPDIERTNKFYDNNIR